MPLLPANQQVLSLIAETDLNQEDVALVWVVTDGGGKTSIPTGMVIMESIVVSTLMFH
jgi:hypothetical protein